MMTFIDNKVPRRDSYLFKLKSLRGNVSSTDPINETKDDTIANPNSTDSQKHIRQQRDTNNNSAMGYSSTTDRIRNKRSSSSNINSRMESNTSTTPFVSQQEQGIHLKGMSDSERSLARELMISKPAADENDMDYGNASSNRSRAGSGDAASRYSQRSHRSHHTLRTEQSVGSTAMSKGGLSSKQESTTQSSAPNLFQSRCQQWLALSLTHLISIASLDQGTHSSSSSSEPSSFGGYYYASSSTDSNHPRRSNVEVAVLTLLSLAFTVSFVIGVGYFHGPFREYITIKDESATYVRGGATSFNKLREFITVEQLLSLLLLVVLSTSSGLVLSTNDNNGGGSYANYLAVAGSEIWNANLFYGTWVGLYGGAYLTAHSLFCPGYDDDDVRDNHGVKLWFLMLLSSICASATMLSVYSSNTCQPYVLAESSYCQSSLASGLLMACTALISLCVMASTKSNLGAKVRLIYVVSSSILLFLNSTALGVVSSPSGAGAEVGSVFLVSWMTWIIGVVLWKDCIIESFVTLHEEERRAVYGSFRNSTLGFTKKKTRKQQRRRRRSKSKNFNDVGSRSEATYACTDEEGTTGDEVMEDDDNSEDDGYLGGNMSQFEFNHCLDSISKNTDDDDDPRRHPLDPDGPLNRFHVSKTASDHSFGRLKQEDPEGDRKEELDHFQQENLNGRHAPPRDATEFYETTSSRGGLDKSSYSSAYYSGSDAVQVQAGSQGEVSTLGHTLSQPTLLGNSNQHEDPGGMRGGSMLPNGRDINSNNNNDGGTPQHRNYVQVEPPATNGGRRPILRDPSAYNDDDDSGPDRQYLPNKDETPTSPVMIRKASQASSGGVMNRNASQASSGGVDKEWDFALSPEPPTPTPVAKKARAKKKTTTTAAQTPLKTLVVHKATADTQGIPLPRRPSRDSLMSNCPPIEEGSQETSPESRTGVTNKSGSGVSGPVTTSKSTKGGVSAKNGKRSNTKNVIRGKTPPAPPRSEKKKQNRAAGLVQRDDSGVSSSIPGAVYEGSKKEAKKQASSSSEHSHSVSTSSSDFDIEVSADHSVITELTAEGFDVPGDYTSSSAGAAAKVDTEAAANHSTHMPKRNNAQKSSTSLSPPSANSPPSLPPRLPLYNSSHNSPPSNKSTSPGDSENTPAGLRGQDVHPSVESFLVSAMKNARLSKGYSNMDEMPATTNEEGGKSGGVNSAGSSKGKKRRGNGSGSEGREKRTQEGSSQRKRSQFTPRKLRSKESARKKGEPDTDNARPKSKVLSVPNKDGK